MSASRFLVRTGLLSKFARRAFATEVAISPAPRLEHYSPVEMERTDIAEALATKAKKPWTELSKEDKIASKFKWNKMCGTICFCRPSTLVCEPLPQNDKKAKFPIAK